MFVSAGSASTQRDVAVGERRARAPRGRSTRRPASSRSSGTGGPRLPSARTTLSAVERRERLVDRAVVAPVEDEDLRPAGDVPREPDREAVRVGRGERELPARQRRSAGSAPPPTQSASSLGSISRDPARRLLGDRAHASAPASGRSSRRCRRGRSRRTRGRRRRVKRAPRASAAKTGKPPGQRTIQCIGTPARRCSAPARQLARARVLALEALLLAAREGGEGRCRPADPGIRLQSDTSACGGDASGAGVGLKSDTGFTSLTRAGSSGPSPARRREAPRPRRRPRRPCPSARNRAASRATHRRRPTRSSPP